MYALRYLDSACIGQPCHARCRLDDVFCVDASVIRIYAAVPCTVPACPPRAMPYTASPRLPDALGVGRQLVAAWRRRRSHGMPEPVAELASGPVWLGHTIEPWIEALPVRPSGAPPSPTAAEIWQLARRSLRL